MFSPLCFCPWGGYVSSRLPAGPDFGVFRPDGSSNADMRLKSGSHAARNGLSAVTSELTSGTPSPCSDSRQVEENQLNETLK